MTHGWFFVSHVSPFEKLSWSSQFRRQRAGPVCQLCEVEPGNERVGVTVDGGTGDSSM